VLLGLGIAGVAVSRAGSKPSRGNAEVALAPASQRAATTEASGAVSDGTLNAAEFVDLVMATRARYRSFEGRIHKTSYKKAVIAADDTPYMVADVAWRMKGNDFKWNRIES